MRSALKGQKYRSGTSKFGHILVDRPQQKKENFTASKPLQGHHQFTKVTFPFPEDKSHMTNLNFIEHHDCKILPSSLQPLTLASMTSVNFKHRKHQHSWE